MNFFKYDKTSGLVTLDVDEILLVKELNSLLEEERNKSKSDNTGIRKERAFKELTYIFLFFDWDSPYAQFAEQDRHEEAFNDSKLTKDEFDDPVFREACRKYDSLQNSSLEIRLLQAAMKAIDGQIYYLEHIDLQERDSVTGKPIFKSKDLIAEIKGCKDLITSLQDLKAQVKKGLQAESTIRGDVKTGLFD